MSRQKIKILYHGSSQKIKGPLKPVLNITSSDNIHQKPAVFATERADLAALFMLSSDILHSIGFEENIPYICIWGTAEELLKRENIKGFLYLLPDETFKKVGKDYEWQSFEEVTPIEIKEYSSAVEGMIENGVQVYFINDDSLFDKVVANKNNRLSFLKNIISENQRLQKHS